MSKSAKSLLVVMATVLGFVGVASAEDGVGVDVSLDVFGKYLWRGQVINDDPVLQPGVSMTFDKLTLGFWGSVDMTDYSDNEWEFIEYDYSADYTTAIAEGVDLSFGVINYYFPGSEDTTEIYAGLAFDLPLSPSVTIYNDVDEVNGSYVSFAVGHSFEDVFQLSDDVSVPMEIGASLGWGSKSYNKAYWGGPADSSSLNDLSLSAAFPISLGSWTITPSVNYVTLLDSDVRSSDAFDTASDYFFAGIGFSTSF